MIDYSLILEIFYSDKKWILNGESYDGLTWMDTSEKPTQKILDSKYPDAIRIKKSKNCKLEAKILISKTDWAVLPDVKIENKSEFENYRSILRNYIINPVENPIFPPEPDPIWIAN